MPNPATSFVKPVSNLRPWRCYRQTRRDTKARRKRQQISRAVSGMPQRPVSVSRV
ncbi:hypothetical protein BKA66DRAFT_451288 [Pyrenochaeta sp. MPI-SDFR-AT-0127]|nr:hypothetical protein BKA66DRAFT_451288 [Pyrenochaeta sp. MPI-SDFR-AT-0127]